MENAALESAAQELIQQAHMMVNEKHFNALHLKIKIQIVVQCLIRNQNRCFIYLVAFLSSYHEKATERCTSLLWSCRLLMVFMTSYSVLIENQNQIFISTIK